MSIFEPIPRDGHGPSSSDVDAERDAPAATSLDPRSIKIAGIVLAGVVLTGLVATNLAARDNHPRPVVSARVAPGAAAVERAEAKQVVPTGAASAGPSASPSAPVEEPADAPAESTWQAPEDSGDDSSDGGSKWDRRDKPGRGHGRKHG